MKHFKLNSFKLKSVLFVNLIPDRCLSFPDNSEIFSLLRYFLIEQMNYCLCVSVDVSIMKKKDDAFQTE